MKNENIVNVIKGIDFLKDYTKRLAIGNDIEHEGEVIVSHLSYDETISVETHKYHKATITHDGTLLFLNNKLYEMFWDFVARKLIPLEYKDVPEEDLPQFKYVIGDVIIENEYNVETEKSFPMMSQTITIPYDFIIGEGEDC